MLGICVNVDYVFLKLIVLPKSEKQKQNEEDCSLIINIYRYDNFRNFGSSYGLHQQLWGHRAHQNWT
jgi:hypothetical protein